MLVAARRILNSSWNASEAMCAGILLQKVLIWADNIQVAPSGPPACLLWFALTGHFQKQLRNARPESPDAHPQQRSGSEDFRFPQIQIWMLQHTQVGSLEADNRHQKQGLAQRMSTIKTLESRVTSLQLDLQDSQSQVGRSFLQCKYVIPHTHQSTSCLHDGIKGMKMLESWVTSLQSDLLAGHSQVGRLPVQDYRTRVVHSATVRNRVGKVPCPHLWGWAKLLGTGKKNATVLHTLNTEGLEAQTAAKVRETRLCKVLSKVRK